MKVIELVRSSIMKYVCITSKDIVVNCEVCDLTDDVKQLPVEKWSVDGDTLRITVEDENKKFLFPITHFACGLGETKGYVKLTKAEAKVVSYAIDEDNWVNIKKSGCDDIAYMHIDLDEYKEIDE